MSILRTINDMRNHALHMVLWIIYWLILVTSFLAIGFTLTSRAMGYRYNPLVRAYQKMGMIVIDNPPNNSYFLIDGKSHFLQETMRLPNILPGIYRVRLEKNGYIPWEKRIEIKPGLVVHLKDVSLFNKTPIFDQNISAYTNQLPYYKGEGAGVRIVEDELWIGADFVSRFSAKPSNALLLPNQKYILYLINNEVRAIHRSGEQDTLLLTRSSSEPLPFAYIDNALVFQDGGEIKAMKIEL